MAEETTQKMENIILELNKTGLSYLVANQFTEAVDYFKKAERQVTEELRIAPDNQKINQIAGITFNNLACYYKKNNKPKVALGYLKKALELEVYRVEDWVSTASTHINICAIYSHLGKHSESAEHAELALTMLQKVDPKNLKEESDGEKSYWNIKMLSHYNFAIQLEHLKKFNEAKNQYNLAKQTAEVNPKKNENIINAIDQSMKRIQQSEQNQKKKLVEILAKRKIQEEKGNHQFMRRNKKNYGDQAEWKSIVQSKKYELYKTQSDTKRQYQSTQKVKKLAPLNDGSRSKRGLELP